MKTALIGPDSLELDAVVPQCLDNQYVSDRVFRRMIEKGADYEDAAVMAARAHDFRTEFIRSLIYSSQVVIQRAFLRNSEFLYRYYLPEARNDLAAFAGLVRDKAIVPYLFKEDSLLDRVEFDVRRDGDRAAKALIDEVGDRVTCVRLAVNSAENARLASALGTEFGSRLTRSDFMGSEQLNAMAAELFYDSDRLREEGAWRKFEDSLDKLATACRRRSRELRDTKNPHISRQDVYREHFAADGKDENVARGRFRPPTRDEPFLFELKKYVDLVYNSNLPDQLGRYTFTPATLPARVAMQDFSATGFTHEQVSRLLAHSEALEATRRIFMAHSQRAMTLPLLQDLSITDVSEIRSLPEWEPFKLAQVRILREPMRCLEYLESFHQTFDQFQRALSRWYNERYQRPRTVARYVSYITLALSVAGKLIVADSGLGSVDKALLMTAGEHLPYRVKGYAAKLLVGVYDIGSRRLDAERSYSIDLMNTNAELLREDVLELLQSMKYWEGTAPVSAAGLADQGAM